MILEERIRRNAGSRPLEQPTYQFGKVWAREVTVIRCRCIGGRKCCHFASPDKRCRL